MEIINQQEVLGKNFTVYGTFDNPLFLAKDVAEWIEYNKNSNGDYDVSQMLETVDDDEKVKIFGSLPTMYNVPIPTESGNYVGTNRWFVKEDGLYEILMQSRKPIAKAFKKKVKEILKELRTKGITATPATIDAILADPEFGIKLLSNLKEERAKRTEAEKRLEAQNQKVLFADAVLTSDRSVLVSELAKILMQNGIDTGQNRLFVWLRENGYLCSKGEYYNQPTQKAMQLGLFELKKTSIPKPDGSILVTVTTKVTGKGQIYFVNKFLKNKKPK